MGALIVFVLAFFIAIAFMYNSDKGYSTVQLFFTKLLGKDGESGWPSGNSDLLSVAGVRKNGAFYETGGVCLRSC